MRKIAFVILILILNSCHFIGKGSGIKFEIINNSDTPIKNVKFTTSEYVNAIEFDKIGVNKSVSGFLSMKNNKADGHYVLEFTQLTGNRVIKGHGYYSNGSAMESWVAFKINNDTITHSFSKIK